MQAAAETAKDEKRWWPGSLLAEPSVELRGDLQLALCTAKPQVKLQQEQGNPTWRWNAGCESNFSKRPLLQVMPNSSKLYPSRRIIAPTSLARTVPPWVDSNIARRAAAVPGGITYEQETEVMRTKLRQTLLFRQYGDT